MQNGLHQVPINLPTRPPENPDGSQLMNKDCSKLSGSSRGPLVALPLAPMASIRL